MLGRPGVWHFAGFDRILSGLDLNEALLSLSDDCDRDLARRYLRVAELGFMRSYLEKHGSHK